MLAVRTYRTDELPAILRAGLQTARDQLVARDLPGATPDGLAGQLSRMYQNAMTVPQSTILVVDWPPGMAGDGPAAYALLMPQPNAFTGERELVVMDIYTNPALRGRRVGRLLLQRAAEYGRSIGCASMVAQVALHNQASLAMFRGSGYNLERVIVGRRC